MPNAPKTFRPHGQAKRQDYRLPAHKRGYDKRWEKLRNRFIRNNPLCEHCEKVGRVRPAEEIDHIKPFHGIDDPLRLDEGNLQALCKSCHTAKTNRDQGRGG